LNDKEIIERMDRIGRTNMIERCDHTMMVNILKIVYDTITMQYMAGVQHAKGYLFALQLQNMMQISHFRGSLI